MVVCDDVSDDGLLIGMVYADICKKDVTGCDRVCDGEVQELRDQDGLYLPGPEVW